MNWPSAFSPPLWNNLAVKGGPHPNISAGQDILAVVKKKPFMTALVFFWLAGVFKFNLLP
jgi:hypothetical protein